MCDKSTESALKAACLSISSVKLFAALENVVRSTDLSDIIRRYCVDFNLPLHQGGLHARELMRYFVLSLMFPAFDFPITGGADHFWHVFLLFTRRYSDFSNNIAGRFLHHEPADSQSFGLDQHRTNIKQYELFRQAYEAMYLAEPPEIVWPNINQMNSRSFEFKVL